MLRRDEAKTPEATLQYNAVMSEFNFYQPVEVRYGDLDPQGHVNNARFVTYLEHARVGYVRELGLWDGKSFLEVGFIIARLEVDFQAPILITDQVRIGVRISRLGGKSLEMTYRMESPEDGTVYAEALTVLVSYDYRRGQTRELPDRWRDEVSVFENIPRRAPG
jgi:acyl-CoA thioester hydrolase